MAGVIPPRIPRDRLEAFEKELARLERERQARQTRPAPEPDEHLESAYEDAISGGADE